ncbi:helix-turn-helix domain-containing protein [Azorhizobium oxalatiphilum]|uniref:helix-turn-helix domain-containing protein n=1 Tax=Azorhizobium oxalatiphilum TaxID=980631 RepID=UPI001664DC47|nr:XRE family transcriptional regulator [Azorhizobium oxalatiphilum]
MNKKTSEPSEMLDTSPVLGEEIRHHRTARGWTLEELSKRSGVSIAAISKIEKGQSRPSFDTLLRIARCLQINFVQMMEGEGPSKPKGVTARLTSTRAADAELFQTAHYDYRVHSTSLTQKVMVPLRMTIRNHEPPPRDEWSIHDGEEFVFVLKGTLAFHTEHYAPLILKEGDSCYLDSTMRHAFVAVSPGDVEILSVCLSIKPFEGEAGPESI